jgi:DNA-binding MarR family transcriptional regulator
MPPSPSATPRKRLEALAAFRFALRRFLAFSERNAKRFGLTPQQHQALLSIKAGYVGRDTITIGELAEHLLLKHHSAVELADRLEKAGLVKRSRSKLVRTSVVMLSLTPRAETVLARLSLDNIDALRHASPAIVELMRALDRASAPRGARRSHRASRPSGVATRRKN